MPIDDTSQTSRDEVLRDVPYRVDDCGGSDMVNDYFGKLRIRNLPLPIKIVAEGGALDGPAWNGVAVDCGRERSVTRTCR